MPDRSRLLALWLIALVAGVIIGSLRISDPPTEVRFLAVGQGDCTVIRYEGLTVMVDAGPASVEFDAGDRVIAPKLRQMGVQSIDFLLLTHPDSDHVGGFPALAARLPIRKVAIPAVFQNHPEMLKTLLLARISPRDVAWLRGDWSLQHSGLQLFIRAPSRIMGEGDNEGSPFVRVLIDGASLVLTGDASEEAEAIQASQGDWRAMLLKAGHHGSAHSTSEAWLQEVRPERVVVSCGQDNRNGHPAAATLARIQKAGAQVSRTDLEGDLCFSVRRGLFIPFKP